MSFAYRVSSAGDFLRASPAVGKSRARTNSSCEMHSPSRSLKQKYKQTKQRQNFNVWWVIGIKAQILLHYFSNTFLFNSNSILKHRISKKDITISVKKMDKNKQRLDSCINNFKWTFIPRTKIYLLNLIINFNI